MKEKRKKPEELPTGSGNIHQIQTFTLKKYE